MNSDNIFLFFTNCKVVKGAKRSIVCDLQRGDFDFIPNGLATILIQHKGKSLKEIKALFDESSSQTIDEYFEFLISKEFGFWGDDEDRGLFPDIDMTWEFPGTITNSIIDVDENSNHNFQQIFSELEELGCRDLQIRYYAETDFLDLNRIMSLLTFSRIKSVELIIKNSEGLSFENLEKLTQQHPRIRSIYVHSSTINKLARINQINGRGNIIYIEDVIDSSVHCGVINPTNFVINLPAFIESQKFNSCLHGKISIDATGNIKNCPSMNISFGQFGKTSLKDVSLRDEFTEIWDIGKEQIKVCKDCEFRHICSDCRAYTTDQYDPYSKPFKCGYDPYTAKWA